jgi:hypothetical protein
MANYRICDNCGVGVRNAYWMEVILHGRDGAPLHTGEERAGRDYCVPCLSDLANGSWEALISRRVIAAPTKDDRAPFEIAWDEMDAEEAILPDG